MPAKEPVRHKRPKSRGTREPWLDDLVRAATEGMAHSAAAHKMLVDSTVEAIKDWKPPELSLPDFGQLEDIQQQMGVPIFTLSIRERLQEQMRGWEEALAAINAARKAALEEAARTYEATRPLFELITRASEGDIEAICWWLERDPIDTLRVEKITEHLETLRASRSPEAISDLEMVAKAFRKGLVRPRRGKRPRVEDRSVIVSMTERLQQLYQDAPLKLRREYRNEALRRQDIREIRRYFEEHFPEPTNPGIGKAVEDVLSRVTHNGRTVQWKSGFAVEATAMIYGYSTRRIRSILRNQKK